jgi:hypothetical protein
VKRYYADDSAATSVKVGYRQASYKEKAPAEMLGFFFVCRFCNLAVTKPSVSLDALEAAPSANGGVFSSRFK